jgi:hypothetical protein
MTAAEYRHRTEAMEKEALKLRLALTTAEGQRNRAREIADALAPALRRCCEDSKDLLAEEKPDTPWVKANIRIAEDALELHREKDWRSL